MLSSLGLLIYACILLEVYSSAVKLPIGLPCVRNPVIWWYCKVGCFSDKAILHCRFGISAA